MVHIFVTCGVWISSERKGWRFNTDEQKGGRLLAVDSNTSLDELKNMVSEDYGVEQSTGDIEFSYLPNDFSNTNFPPVIIANDRQLTNFVGYMKKTTSTQLCVTFKAMIGNENNEPSNSTNEKEEELLQNNLQHSPVTCDEADEVLSGKKDDIEKEIRFSLEDVKKHQHFISKNVLKAKLEICAMKYNFDFKVVKSDTKLWSVRCADNLCNWSVRAQCLEGSRYFVINKHVAEHICAPSSKSNFGRTPSEKTIGTMIMHRYDGIKEGPKPNEIIQMMRTEHGSELSYSLAWDSREYAVNAVRGIPEESYSKIPKYLHMLKEANLGTHSSYETDCLGRFKYLFIAFGQSVRGFYNAIRRVIVVDGTFLKSKYKGVLLVATALDGNFNLYPIAFGVVDSENNNSWEWFFRQLKVVIADDDGLAFVTDRNESIIRGLKTVYPQAKHGICIHHLLNNVVKHFKGKGLLGLVAKASKAYRLADFERRFADICNISPSIGKYLVDADVTKWTRCGFPGYRYDIRTTNPTESMNSALRSPREFPVIPLLDSIREMVTRWFHDRRILSSKHNNPLTIEVEKKIERRIDKGKTFSVHPIIGDKFLVRGDQHDCLVDLESRTCTCRKYDLLKIPCIHAIKAGFSVGKEAHTLTDELYTTVSWKTAYEESINPIAVPEDDWQVPPDVEHAQVLQPETRRAAGRRRKRRYETVEDKIRSSQGSQRSRKVKCSRCGVQGHNRATCDRPI